MDLNGRVTFEADTQTMEKLVTLVFLLLALVTRAQDLQTDRPNETEMPTTIKPGHLQFEMGLAYEQEDGADVYEAPEIVLRYGVFKHAEVRLESDIIYNGGENGGVTGIEPLKIGAKYQLLKHHKLIPDLGILARLIVPFLADGGLREPYYGPEVRLLTQHTITKNCHIGTNLGVQWTTDGKQPEYIYTLTADHSLTQKLKCFVEG